MNWEPPDFEPVGSAALRVVPVVGEGIKAWRNRDEVRNLFRELKREIKGDRQIPRGKRKRVWKRVDGLRTDPEFLGCVRALVEEVDVDALSAMRTRLEQLIRFEDQEISDSEVVDRVIVAVDRAVGRAQRRPEDAAYVHRQLTVRPLRGAISDAAQRIASEVGAQFDRQQVETQERHDELLAALGRRAPAAGSSPAGAVQNGHTTREEQHLSELEAQSPGEGQWLRARWQTGGVAGLANLVETPEAVLETGSALLWEKVGRLLGQHAQFTAAERAFLQASERDSDQPVRQLMRAAGYAHVRGDVERFRQLSDRARALPHGAEDPAVIIVEARDLIDNPDEGLARLTSVVPRDALERSSLEVTRAQLQLAAGAFNEAEQSIARAREADPENLGARELDALLVLLRNQEAVRRDDQPESQALREAATSFCDLRDRLRSERRFAESGHMLARAAEALLLAGDDAAARGRLDELVDEERSAEGSVALARLTLLTGQPEATLRLLPADRGDDASRVFRATALTRSAEENRVREGIGQLRSLIADAREEGVAQMAAFSMLAAASLHAFVEWDEAAADLISQDDPVAVAALRADHLALRGDHRGAETALLAHGDDPVALNGLVELSITQEDWATAKQRSEALLSRDDAPANRFNHAGILRRLGQLADAAEQLTQLARDTAHPLALRQRAYVGASEIAVEVGDFAEADRLTDEWLALAPDDEDAGWFKVFVLARLIRHGEAIDLLQALPVRNENQALLSAEVHYRASDPVTAVRRISELSDQFDRRAERLEALVLFAALRRRGPLPEPLAERVREGFRTFPEKFPDSQLIWTAPAPTTREEFDALAVELMGEETEQRQKYERQVRDGQAPVALLAALAGRAVSDTWARLYLLPIGYSDEALDDAERIDATEMLGSPAVWDPASLIVVAGLIPGLTDRIRNALPGSLIPYASFHDADRAATSVDPDDKEQMLFGYDAATGAATLTTFSEEMTDELRTRSRRCFELAQALNLAPDTDARSADPLDDFLRPDEDHNPALATWAASLSVARRTGAPLYSDDRSVRFLARRDGIPSFGTLALLDALSERGLITADERQAARLQILDAGAWGVRATAEELIATTHVAGWVLTRALASALHDVQAWRADPVGMWRTVATFLEEVYDKAPERMPIWTARSIDAAAEVMPQRDAVFHQVALLVVAWDPLSVPPRNSDRCFQALIEALRQLPPHLRPLGRDPVQEALRQMLRAVQHRTPHERAMVFLRASRRLGFADRANAWIRFVG